MACPGTDGNNTECIHVYVNLASIVLLNMCCVTLVSCFMTAQRGQLVHVDHSAVAEELHSLKPMYGFLVML